MHEQNESQPKAFIKILFALFTALLVVVLGYLCIQSYTIFHRTYKTETAIAYTMSDNITLKGVAVFQAVDVPGSGNLGYVVQDGERVSAGTILAEQYTDDSQGAMRERLDRLDRAILLLTKSENSSGSDLSVLTTQTRTALYNLLDQIDTASYGAIQDAAEDFLLAQNKLQISTGQAAGFGEVLASLQAERDGIAAQLNGLQTIEADTNGYFVSSESAAPVVRDSAELDAMSPADLQKMINAGETPSNSDLAGHIVTGFSWRFYAVCSADLAGRLNGLSRVSISVPGKQEEPLAATVVDVTTDEETGLAKVVLECRSINAQVLCLNYEEAEISLHTYQGIRIDRRALHIVNGQRGVYVKYGDLQRFRRITILYEDDTYILVPDGGKAGEDNELRLYDEVIVEGSNLQDGKLL